jgi:hypothetical protein
VGNTNRLLLDDEFGGEGDLIDELFTRERTTSVSYGNCVTSIFAGLRLLISFVGSDPGVRGSCIDEEIV